jgi:hypothetical protein
MPQSPNHQVKVEPLEGVLEADLIYVTEVDNSSGLKRRAFRVHITLRALALTGAATFGAMLALIAGH